MIWLLCGYMWLFIHRPFEVWPILGTLHIERAYMIVTILYWIFIADKSWISNRLNVAFFGLALVIIISTILSPYGVGVNLTIDNWFKVAVFFILVISSVRTEADLKCLIIMFIVSMGLYMLHSLREFLDGRHEFRMGVARMIGVDVTMNNPNAFSSTILYALILVYPLWRLAYKKLWCLVLLLSYMGISILCIILTGSRQGFVGLCLLALIIVIVSKRRLIALLALIMIAPVIWLSLRADLQNRFMTLYDASYGPMNAQRSAESRLQGLYDGVKIWEQYPITGCGPGCFGLARGNDIQAHNLYGQVLGEVGITGAFAFGMVLWAFYSNARDTRLLCRDFQDLNSCFAKWVVDSVTVTIILMLILGYGGHSLYRYTWLWYGAFSSVAIYILREKVEMHLAEGSASITWPQTVTFFT